MKLILKLSNVAEGSTVRKPTGEKPLTVRDAIRIYGEQKTEIKADKGVRFLVDATGGITAASSDSDVAIWGDPDELAYVLLRMSNHLGPA